MTTHYFISSSRCIKTLSSSLFWTIMRKLCHQKSYKKSNMSHFNHNGHKWFIRTNTSWFIILFKNFLISCRCSMRLKLNYYLKSEHICISSITYCQRNLMILFWNQMVSSSSITYVCTMMKPWEIFMGASYLSVSMYTRNTMGFLWKKKKA